MVFIPFQVFNWDKVEKFKYKGERGIAIWQTIIVGTIRIRKVQYSKNYLADHWCQKGHIVHCLQGQLNIELKDGEKLFLTQGDTYVVSDQASSHRSSNVNTVKLFIVDGDFLK